MSKLVTELRIINADVTLFDTDCCYQIPLYQRSYAWEDKQIIQMIEDIMDIAPNANYYIGSLIVSRRDNNVFEVIDGQQRLTTLFLLLNYCLEKEVKASLSFACRSRSNYTLKNIKQIITDDLGKLDPDKFEQSIIKGIKAIRDTLGGFDKQKRERLIDNLKRVILYRIEVPRNTDLNRYFEIMNTRGEQLEQHDILKAELMSYLPDDREKRAFAKIWEACSDMTGYVQMHFISRNNETREGLFGKWWNGDPPADWSVYRDCLGKTSSGTSSSRIIDIIKENFDADDYDGFDETEGRVRFESIIEFPFFLLHSLKVLISIKGIKHVNAGEQIAFEALDDKKLVDSFTRVVDYGVTETGRLSDSKASFAQDFIICLLRTRFLFDKFIIKREFENENSDGEWSLKNLHISNLTSKRVYYSNTRFSKKNEKYTTNDRRVKNNIMIQSALRVSYTSPKAMHWITRLLLWLSENNYQHSYESPDDLINFTSIAEDIAKASVRENFFGVPEGNPFEMGVNTPHIVFNFLDYILWKRRGELPEYKNCSFDSFEFEFRNSVEHWYPRHPSEGSFDRWIDGVDRFGNLCLIQRNVNSKFSNMSPEAKKSTFEEMIKKGSLKLRIMSLLTSQENGKTASANWRETGCQKHEAEMLAILREACGISEATDGEGETQ